MVCDQRREGKSESTGAISAMQQSLCTAALPRLERIFQRADVEAITAAIEKMSAYNISQLPVKENGSFVGSLDESSVYKKLLKEPHITSEKVSGLMNKPFPVVDESSDLEEISKMINKDNQAVIVKKKDGEHHIITMHDIIETLK